MNYKKLFRLEMMLENYLNDIEEYSESAYRYLLNQSDELDEDEIIASISSISECTNQIREIVVEIEKEYESERDGQYEQLQ